MKEVVEGNHHSHGYKAIGEVKGRPMESGPVKIQKVDHLAVNHAVHEVAYGPAQDKSKGRDQALLTFRQPSQHHPNETDGQQGKEDEEGETKGRVAPGKDAEGCPGVADIGQAENVSNNWNRVV